MVFFPLATAPKHSTSFPPPPGGGVGCFGAVNTRRKATVPMQHAQLVEAIKAGSPLIPNEAIKASIRKAYPDDAEAILADLKYDTLNRNWFFYRHGMYVGVEDDGYIHT